MENHNLPKIASCRLKTKQKETYLGFIETNSVKFVDFVRKKDKIMYNQHVVEGFKTNYNPKCIS